jgi:hypothetical protein
MLNDVFFTRTWWTADVHRGEQGQLVLVPRRGARARHVSVWRRSLETFNERVEPAEILYARVGDRFVACGPELEETAVLTVEAVDGDGSLRATISAGELAATTSTLQILPMTVASTPRGRAHKGAPYPH